ncbi:MAG TPA: EpsI family protein [Gemmatimonadaceae bacterium]|jgi:EpsI family protein|nr:EpsI family protein [Gemmatimonadaceae bacterium]
MHSWSRYVPAGVLTLGAVITALTGTPRLTPLARPLAASLPAGFLGVNGFDIPIDTEELRVSGVTNYLNRGFNLGDPTPVMLYVGYHATQQGDRGMHSPSVCLPGSGWTPIDSRLVAIPMEGRQIPVNRYVLQKQGQRILVYYWFQGRGRITAGEARLRLDNFKDAFLRHRDEEALVRIVVPIAQQLWDSPVGRTGLPADSVAVRLAQIAIPGVQTALPRAP